MPVLEVTALAKRYGRATAVERVDFAVQEGEVHGLLGPNGSGKTTTLSCCLGLLRPTSGKVQVLGRPASKLHATRGKVGVVFDAPHLIGSQTVERNLAYGARLRGHSGGRSHVEALERVGLSGFEKRRAASLSLGQRKRLSIALALSGSPEFLVLDEPLSGLDPLGTREILRLVRQLAGEGLSILLSSHRLLDVEPVLDRATILLRGNVARSGSLTELLEGGGRCRVQVDKPKVARAALSKIGIAKKQIVDVPGGAPGSLLIHGSELDPAKINRVLVKAGVAVAALDPGRASLAALFEQLVDETAAQKGASE